MYTGVWPPASIGSDVTYLVSYFRSMPSAQPCKLGNFWASADVNGDCNIIGSDITRLVNYFRGLESIITCSGHAPAWPTPADLPPVRPDGWPNCSNTPGNRPDTLKFMFWHSSVGQYMLSGSMAWPDQHWFKVRAQYYLADSLNWPMRWYDYRSNSPGSAPWGGIRDANILDTTAIGSEHALLGTLTHFDFGCTNWNMWPHHMTRMWSQNLDTATVKGRLILPYDLYDTTAAPDTIWEAGLEYNVIWPMQSYMMYADNHDDSLASYKNQYLAFRDSAAQYDDKIFILGLCSPLRLSGNLHPDSADNWNTMKLNNWCLDTLQNVTAYPNFRVWSFYDVLVETDESNPRYGCLQQIYEQSDPSDNHPNNLGGAALQDSTIVWTRRLLEEIENYWD